MKGRSIAVVVMSDNHLEIVRPYTPDIVEAIQQAEPGEIRSVYCGKFVRKKSGNPPTGSE